MKKLLFALLFVMLVIVGAVAALPLFVNSGFVKKQVISAVKTRTGRDLAISGEVSFSWFPGMTFNMADVSLSGPPDSGDAPLLRTKSLNVRLKIWPLLRREVEVDEFILKQPEINLRIAGDGRRNWDFKTSARPSSQRQSAPMATGTTESRNSPARPMPVSGLRDLQLGDIRIIDGRLSYRDDRTDTREDFEAINIALGAPDFSQTFRATGSVNWRGEKVEADIELASLRRLLAGDVTPLAADISSALLKSSFSGEVRMGGTFALNGGFTAGTKSAPGLGRWLGGNDGTQTGVREVDIDGILAATEQQFTLSNATLRLDAMHGRGSVQLVPGPARSKIKGRLAFDVIDLNRLMGTETPAAGKTAGQLPALRGPTEGNNKTSSVGKPRNNNEGWSRKPVSFAALKSVDAELDLTSKRLLYRDIQTGHGKLSVTLDNGRLIATLEELDLYGGTAAGSLTLDARSGTPVFYSAFQARDISALAFLRDATGFDRISGIGRLKLQLAARGRSEQEMVQSLNGKSSLAFSDGAIEGIDIAAMIRSLKQGNLTGWHTNERAKTDFSSLTGSFRITKGVALNEDLRLVSPLLGMTGEGTVDIARKQLDYSATPKIAANAGSQAGVEGLAGIAIPVRIKGPWSKPQFLPDLEKIIANPKDVIGTVESLRQALRNSGKKKNLGGLLNQVLGGQKKQTAGDAPKPKKSKTGKDFPRAPSAEDILKDLF